MKLGIIGLGRMGMSIAKRVLKSGNEVIGYDQNIQACKSLAKIGGVVASSILDITDNARVIWLMVPAGEAVDSVLKILEPALRSNDIIIDGGNSFFEDSVRRSKFLAKKKVYYLDCGTSGGLHGEKIGFSLMIGGDKKAFNKIKSLISIIASKNGFAYIGNSGSGHYVKMVHNGIEYALLQSYAEGFHLLREGAYKNLDLEKIAHVWNHGSIIRSWILELLENIFTEDQKLEHISGEIGENKTGFWTSQEAKKRNVSIKLIKDALNIRAASRKNGGDYGTKLVAMLRGKFGGHEVTKK